MTKGTPWKATIVTGALVLGTACSTPRDAARSDSAAGGSPTAKLDSTSNPATIDGRTADTTTGRAGAADTMRTPPRTP